MGVEIKVEGLTKRFGRQTIWEDVSLTLPAGEISVLLGPSGTGKSVFLKTVVGLLKPNNGHIWIQGRDVPTLREHELYEVRKLFGVLFQDGALFGSQSLYDNIAFPLREHTKKKETEIRQIVLEKMEMVGLLGAEDKLPGEISGGMRKRAGLARALVLDPEIILFDEPDSGLDPVRVAYLNQLIVDLNAQIGATFLIVTHDINTARTVPDNIGLLYRRHLAMFGPREQLLTSQEPVVRQFLNGKRQGPIGMSEEKDAATLAAEMEEGQDLGELPPIEDQLLPTPPLIRRSMRSPHGSHAFLRDGRDTPEPREVVEVSRPTTNVRVAEAPAQRDSAALEAARRLSSAARTPTSRAGSAKPAPAPRAATKPAPKVATKPASKAGSKPAPKPAPRSASKPAPKSSSAAAPKAPAKAAPKPPAKSSVKAAPKPLATSAKPAVKSTTGRRSSPGGR